MLEGKERLGRVFAAKMVRKIIKKSHPKSFYHFFPVMAALSVANIVKTSLGPVGLDKMLVDDVGVREFIIAIVFRRIGL